MLDSRFYFKPHYENSRAIVVGINKYNNVSPLSCAVNDATEFAKILREDFSFPNDNIALLLDEEATRENILYKYSELAKNSNHDDRIIFYFAGHGHTMTGMHGEVGFLIPHDAGENFSTYIPWDYLTKHSDLIHAKHMLFIMDACYGGLALTRNTSPGSTRFLNDMLLRLSRQVLTSGKANEVVSDSGGPIPGHSVFTGHLINGLRGDASSPEGIMTASGLMSYVYSKVSGDINSNQTPHYGHFGGDGDFIFLMPETLREDDEPGTKSRDHIIVIPYQEDLLPTNSTQEKIKKCKTLLASDSSFIELHDFATEELRRFLSLTSEDNFKTQEAYSKEELLCRISRYEELCNDISLISTCISYWGKQVHHPILQKIFSRSTDRISTTGGMLAWIHLRWYPIIIQLYCAGIAATDGKRYDSLAKIFNTYTTSEENPVNTEYFIGAIGNGISELTGLGAFKQIPGHERNYTPMSEYLFKLLQPKLDDTLFIGKGYEKSFDEFEILLALSIADYKKQNDSHVWGPIGRFGWKAQHSYRNPLKQLFEEAERDGLNWPPLKAGLFGGDIERFKSISTEYHESIKKLHWL